MADGPYIVTTKLSAAIPSSKPCERPYDALSRVAVATLGDAQGRAHDVVFRVESEASDEGPIKAFDQAYETLLRLPESGGTVGPLPDGTVIEVEPTTWADLATPSERGRTTYHQGSYQWDQQRILDAFNAKE